MAELKGSYRGGLKLAPLPKPEYQRMKKIVKEFGLESDSHLLQICIRLFEEVRYWGSTEFPHHGANWVARIIAESKVTELPELEQAELSDPIGKGPTG